jgi:hypothetical protein
MRLRDEFGDAFPDLLLLDVAKGFISYFTNQPVNTLAYRLLPILAFIPEMTIK